MICILILSISCMYSCSEGEDENDDSNLGGDIDSISTEADKEDYELMTENDLFEIEIEIDKNIGKENNTNDVRHTSRYVGDISAS